MFAVDYEGGRATRLLDGIGRRLGDPHDMLDLLVDNVHEFERDLFASGGNGQWPALSDKTVALKGSSRILVDSGNLLEGLTSNADLLGDEAVVEADVAYAGFHTRTRNPAPEPPADVVADWAEDLLGFIVGGNR